MPIYVPPIVEWVSRSGDGALPGSLPYTSTSTLKPIVDLVILSTRRYISRREACFHTSHGCVCYLLLLLLPAFTVTPIEEQVLVALTRLRVATLSACLRSKPLQTSTSFCFLCSTKLSRLPGRLASSKSGTSDSRDARGLRLNKSSDDVILDGSDESGRVRLIHLAGVTCSSQRSGQALRSSANICWSYPLNLSIVP